MIYTKSRQIFLVVKKQRKEKAVSWRNERNRKEFNGRRSQRYGEIGRKFEQEGMRKILEGMVSRGVLTGFEIFAPNSPEDREGKDMRLDRMECGEAVSRFCGVTISTRKQQESKLRHPNIPQFCFPIETKPETIERRLMTLFDAE